MAVIVTFWHVLMAHRVVDGQKPINHEMWIQCHVSHCKMQMLSVITVFDACNFTAIVTLQ